MPARQAAGSAANAKRAADDGSGDDEPSAPGPGAKMKLPRLDRGSEDFSSVVKNRLQSYTRTGQACDRCKVRKIRCDALPEGCSHCVNLGLECFVTDRVTGRTERRGYLQQLEREKNEMLHHIRDLERLLGDKGVDVKPWTPRSAMDPSGPYGAGSSDDAWTQYGSVKIKGHATSIDGANIKPPTTVAPSAAAGGQIYLSPNFPRSQLESRPEDSSLGVGWDSRPLSSIRGTKLTIMGTTIDTTSFDAPDMDEPPADASIRTPLYNKSVHAFLQSAMGVNPPLQIELPSRNDAFTYSQWFFLIMSPYIPVLHQPTFMKLLERIYDEPDFKPSIPELVHVHMVFAIIYYQYGVRNWQEVERRNQLNDLSNKHYHFSLNKFFDLMASPDLAAVQALVLIACHTRAFPKPGCSAFVCNFAFQRALELNLHRAPRVPESGTNLGIEMRKRTWWVLLSMYVSVTGRRGRPMPITVEEFDVPFPEPINDELISEDGIDTSREMPCEWDVGMATFKIVPILMEMYSNVYSVRRDTQNYSKIIYALEVQLQKWEDELPPGLQRDKSNEHNGLAALYMRMFGLESRLWLRHNSANPTTDKRMMSENTRICEETAREMLQIVQQVISVKALDTTWTQMAVYAMSLFSILVAHWERRFQTTPAKVAELRREMEDWMTVLKEASQLMRSGPQIEVEIRRIVDHTIAWIERDMLSQTRKRSPSPPPAPAVRLKRETASPNTTASQTPPQQSHISAARPSPPVPLQQQQQQPQQPQPQPQPQPQHRRAHTQPHTQPQAQQAQQHIHHASISHAPHRTQSQPLTQVPPQQQPHQHQQQQQQQQITPPQAAARQPASAGPQPVVAHQHEAQPDRSYYSQTNINGHAAYGLGYGEHHRGGQMDPQAYGAETMFYPNSAQQAATAAAAASATGETHPNLLSFAPQTQAVDPTAQFFWRPGGNTWQDWTAAIAQNPSFGNSASLMGLEPAVTTAPEAADHLASLQGGGSTAGDMAAQWPLVMFDQHAQPQNQQHHQSHPSQHYSHGHV